MKFSQTKFQKLNNSQKQKKIFDLLRLIDQSWHLSDQKTKHLLELQKLLKWFDNTDFNDLKKIKPSSTKDIFYSVFIPLEKKYNKNVKDHDFIILSEDRAETLYPPVDVYVILDNLRSAFNVGSIFRTAECFGIPKLLLCGYTANPIQKKVKDTSMGTSELIGWQSYQTTLEAIQSCKKENRKVIAMETTTNAVDLKEFQFCEPIALVLGNEALGIQKDILHNVDEIVRIPLFGRKNSLNVASAFAIALYEISRQLRK